MTDTPEDKARRGTGLTPGHWIAIATIAVAVLGGVLSWALSEHNTRLGETNARLANVESATTSMAEGLARVEGSIETMNERLNGFEERVEDRLNGFEDRVDERLNGFDDRLDRIETNINRLIQLHLDAGTAQPASSVADGAEDTANQDAGTRLRTSR